MIELNIDNFSDEYKEKAPKDCAMFLSSCISEEIYNQLKRIGMN